VRHQRNRRIFNESGIADQNVAVLKYPTQGIRHTKIFRPLRVADMDTDVSGTEATSNEEAFLGKWILF
jgi:hypothetical protein